MDDLLHDFLTETGEHLETVDGELMRLEREPTDTAILQNVFRLVHTVKGTCGFLGLPRLEALAHAAESLLDRVRDGVPVTPAVVSLFLATVDRLRMIVAELERTRAEPSGADTDLIEALETAGAAPAPAHLPATIKAEPLPAELGEATPRGRTVRVRVDALEHLMTNVSELVLTRNRLLTLARQGVEVDALVLPLQRLSQITGDLQDGVMKARLQPVANAWAKLPRLVRDLGQELRKSVELRMAGADTELDGQVIEAIRDPLIHLIRNAVDHGIEGPAERDAAGKPRAGTVQLQAFHGVGTITIEVSDDGRGLDIAAIRHRATRSGLVTAAEAARLPDEQAADLIFHPGLSTTGTISAVSGRGVGLDVVRTNITAVGGTVEAMSRPGAGTTFRIEIPLTLAIVAAVIVVVAGQRFALPRAAVVEFVRLGSSGDGRVERVNNTALLRLRGEILPLLDLATVLHIPAIPDGDRTDPERGGYVAVLEIGRRRVGVVVDAVAGSEDIVVKPLDRLLRHLRVFSGSTILGDGGVVLAVDPAGLLLRAGPEIGARMPEGPAPAPPAGPELATLLLFRGADGSQRAMPLSLVTRLQEVPASGIEWLGGQPCLQHGDVLMPILPAGADTGVRRAGTQPLVVVSDGARPVGLAVDEIVDVVDVPLVLEPLLSRPDLAGTAIVQGRATEIVDLAFLMGGRSPAAARTPPAVLAPGAVPEAGTVLLVDDNPFFRDMLVPVLKAGGFLVRAVSNAPAALAILAGGSVHLVVADLDPAGRDGFDFLQDLRAAPGGETVPVVALASGPSREVVARASALGIRYIVSKFDRSGLLAAVAPAVRKAA